MRIDTLQLLEEELREYLNEHGPATTAEIANWRGMERKNARKVLSALRFQGRIARSNTNHPDEVPIWSVADIRVGQPEPSTIEQPEDIDATGGTDAGED